MVTYYTVVRCVPDVVADERMNIGVIVWSNGRIYSRFTRHFGRLRSLGLTNPSVIRDFVASVTAAEKGQTQLSGELFGQVLTPESLEVAIGTWGGLIQFSERRGSTRPPQVVLEAVSQRVLKGPRATKVRGRGRTEATSFVQREVLEALTDRVGPQSARDLLQRSPLLNGAIEQHQVDAAIRNGHVHLAVNGLSFETLDADDLEAQYRATNYTLLDLRGAGETIPFGVFVFPPKNDASHAVHEIYEQAVWSMRRAGAQVESEQTASTWIHDRVEELPDDALASAAITLHHPS